MKNKKNLSVCYYLVIWAVVVGTFNVLLFLLNHNHTSSFWVTYGFVMGSLVVNLLGFMFTPRNKERLNSITTFCFIYAVLCLIAGIVFFLIKSDVVIVTICVFVILTAIFVIFTVLGSMNQKQIKTVINDNKMLITDMSSLVTYLQDIQKISDNVAIRNSINDLVNFVMGSTPNKENLVEVEDLEKQIFEYSTFIKKNVQLDEVNNVFYNVDKVKKLLKEREAKLR